LGPSSIGLYRLEKVISWYAHFELYLQTGVDTHSLSYAIADGDSIKLSEHNKDFLHYQAQYDFRTNASSVMAKIKTHYPSTPMSALCMVMSYTSFLRGYTVAPIMTLHLVSSYQWQDTDEKLDTEDMLHQARLLDGDNTLV
jgi:hypothetical protein